MVTKLQNHKEIARSAPSDPSDRVYVVVTVSLNSQPTVFYNVEFVWLPSKKSESQHRRISLPWNFFLPRIRSDMILRQPN
jgi:hypothetical protein